MGSNAGRNSQRRNAYGRFLKAAVSGVTELTKSLDTLLPVVAAVGLGFGAKRALGWAGNQLGVRVQSVTQGLTAAKEAARQKALQKQLLQGTQSLTAAERQLLAAKKLVTEEDYRLLAASGRLNTAQLAYLYNQRQINVGTIAHLQQTRAITAEQSRQILQARTRLGLLRLQAQAIAQQAGRTIGGAVMGMVRDPFMWISAIMAGGIAIWQHYEEVAQQAQQAMDSLVQRSQQAREQVNSLLSEGKSNDDAVLAGRIEEILEALRGNVLNYNEIKEQANAIEDLGERYDFLAEKLKLTAAAYKSLGNEATKN